MVLLRNAAKSIALYRQERMVSWLLRNLKNGASRVTRSGPVFISYRHSDGAGLAIALAWALRSAGGVIYLSALTTLLLRPARMSAHHYVASGCLGLFLFTWWFS